MSWFINLLQAIAAFLGVFRQAKVEEQQAAQQAQDELVQETQEAVNEIPGETDSELSDLLSLWPGHAALQDSRSAQVI